MSKKKVNESKNKKQGFLGRSRRFIKIGSFILIFCLIGIGGLLFTHAASTPNVRFVLFCAPDRCSGSVTTINNRAQAVRSWYKAQLGGRTFRMLTTKKVTGHHLSSWYRTGTNIPAINTSDNIYKYESWLHEPNVKTVVILGFPSMDHCGSTPQWTDPSLDWLAVVDPYSQVIGGSDHYCPVQSPVYAHELGHTFNLQHVTESYNLMNGNIACSGSTLGNCHFNSSQKSYLLLYRSSWFPSVNSANSAGYDPDYVPYIEYPYLVDPTDDGTGQLPPPPPPSPPPPTNIGTTLGTNQVLWPNQELVDNGFNLKYQLDGNLVLYNPSGGVIWSTGTNGRSLGNLKMQDDGNLVLYNDYGGVLWSSQTTNSGSSDYLTLQTDGNLVVNTSLNQTVWSSNTGKVNPTPIMLGPVLRANQSLYPNEGMFSYNILYRLSLQLDGNLVEYNNYTNVVKCNSVTFPCSWRDSKPSRLTMQGDGNLVFYNYLNQKIWSSNTQGTGSNNYFGVGASGNLVIYNSYNQWVWSKDTGRLYPTPPPPPPTNIGTTLGTNQVMLPNQELVNNNYNLKYQLDGNLVDYDPTGRVIWSTGTNGRSLGNLKMQDDGNLVLYNDYGGAMWSSGTSGKGSNNYLVLGSDGNLVIETNHNIPVWGLYNGGNIPEYPPNYWGSQPSNLLFSHQLLYPNQTISTNGYQLKYQSDGNLVEYNSIGQALWSTKTNGRSTNNLKMQDDGNLVLYNDYGGVLWSTGTSGTGGANYLTIQPDGNIVVYTASGVPVWHLW